MQAAVHLRRPGRAWVTRPGSTMLARARSWVVAPLLPAVGSGHPSTRRGGEGPRQRTVRLGAIDGSGGRPPISGDDLVGAALARAVTASVPRRSRDSRTFARAVTGALASSASTGPWDDAPRPPWTGVGGGGSLEGQRRSQRVDDLTRSFGGLLGDRLACAIADRGEHAHSGRVRLHDRRWPDRRIELLAGSHRPGSARGHLIDG
jgi:hypothetical protein